MKDILAVILAGGDSTRFWPLKEKTFFPIMGKPLLYHSLDRLKKAGIDEFLIVHTKANEKLVDDFIKVYPQLKIIKALQTDNRSMAGAILSVGQIIKNRPVMFVGPEEVYDDDLPEMVVKSLSDSTEALMVGYEVDHYVPAGYLQIEDGLIKSIVEKPGAGKEPSNLVEFVLHYYRNPGKLTDKLKTFEGEEDDLHEKAVDQLMKEGEKYNFYHYKGYWGQVKYPWSILEISDYYLSKLDHQLMDPTVKISPKAFVSGPVILGPNVKIMAGATVTGPCFIGENTIIGTNAMVRNSMVGNDSVIGFSTEITRSYIGNNCWFHSNYIGDSVISQNASFGAGAVTGNLRLDESEISSKVGEVKIKTGRNKLGAIIGKNVRVGVNASLMPGVKIGENSIVGAGVVLNQDLPENKFCKLEQQYLTVDNITHDVGKGRDKFRNKLKI